MLQALLGPFLQVGLCPPKALAVINRETPSNVGSTQWTHIRLMATSPEGGCLDLCGGWL